MGFKQNEKRKERREEDVFRFLMTVVESWMLTKEMIKAVIASTLQKKLKYQKNNFTTKVERKDDEKK